MRAAAAALRWRRRHDAPAPRTWAVDVRVPAEQRSRAQLHAGRTIAIDLHPPAAGPEVEITAIEEGRYSRDAEHAVRARLSYEGISVLAIRSRPHP